MQCIGFFFLILDIDWTTLMSLVFFLIWCKVGRVGGYSALFVHFVFLSSVFFLRSFTFSVPFFLIFCCDDHKNTAFSSCTLHHIITTAKTRHHGSPWYEALPFSGAAALRRQWNYCYSFVIIIMFLRFMVQPLEKEIVQDDGRNKSILHKKREKRRALIN